MPTPKSCHHATMPPPSPKCLHTDSAVTTSPRPKPSWRPHATLRLDRQGAGPRGASSPSRRCSRRPRPASPPPPTLASRPLSGSWLLKTSPHRMQRKRKFRWRDRLASVALGMPPVHPFEGGGGVNIYERSFHTRARVIKHCLEYSRHRRRGNASDNAQGGRAPCCRCSGSRTLTAARCRRRCSIGASLALLRLEVEMLYQRSVALGAVQCDQECVAQTAQRTLGDCHVLVT